MTKNVVIIATIAGAELIKNEVPENEVPGTAVPENDVNSGSCTAVPENEPEWYRDGDKWVKLFLEPITPGKFRLPDHVYDVSSTNEIPEERWSPEEFRGGFHITRRKDVWFHLYILNYKTAYIAEVVSMDDKLYDNLREHKRRVRVATFGPSVPLADVLGKHPDDFKNGQMLAWSAANNHIKLVKLAVSKNPNRYYDWAFQLALENGNEQIVEFVFEKCENDASRKEMLCNAIRYGRADFVKRMVENTSVDLHFFDVACVNGQFEIFQLLHAKYGEPKCSDIIESALCGGNVDILKYLKSRGVDMSDFEMFVFACTNCEHLQAIKYLVSEGADVKHPLIAYIAKKYAGKEAREYLLSQIDDRSEVPKCEDLDGEINEILTTFDKRIEAGEFDGK
jgi:hypothetical protein